jgi:hypothetical protein
MYIYSLRPYFSALAIAHPDNYCIYDIMSYFLNVNCRYLVILFNKIKVSVGIEECFAPVKYSVW